MINLKQSAGRYFFGCVVAATALGVWISALQLSLMFGTFQKVSLGIFMLWLGWTLLVMRRLWSDQSA